MKDYKTKILLLLLLILAAIFRFYNLNWDEGHFFHPDERNIVNAVSQIDLISQLDPKFYAYGGFLIYLYKLTADILGSILNLPFLSKDWTYINLIGRYYSALFSTLTLLPLFFITEKLFKKRTAIIASCLYIFTVSSIQIAHFSITENLLTLALLLLLYLSLLFLEKPSRKILFIMGIILGISISSKTTGLVFTLVPAIAILILFIKKNLTWYKALLFLFSLLVIALGIFTLFSPFTFLNWPKFIESMRYENSVVLGSNPVVYTLQFNNTIPYLFQLKNLFWQIGPAFLFSLGGIILLIRKFIKKREATILLVACFPLFYFGYVGAWHTKFIRYMVPLIPFFLIAAAFCLEQLLHKKRTLGIIILTFTLLLSVLWAISFFSIYTREQTRITASKWIYKNIPQGNYILTEHWDEGMPVPLIGNSPSEYKQTSLEIYNSDSQAKREYYAEYLSQADYISITTRRLYGTLLYLPDMYPITQRYYQKLFAGELGYTKIKEFTSYPSLFGVEINDDSTEETFQIYDHPKVMIFKNTGNFSKEELQSALQK